MVPTQPFTLVRMAAAWSLLSVTLPPSMNRPPPEDATHSSEFEIPYRPDEVLPLIHVEDLVPMLVAMVSADKIGGSVYNSFAESGSIRFGDGHHALRFSTVGQGYLAASADPELRHGTVTWRVESGEGQFEGATG